MRFIPLIFAIFIAIVAMYMPGYIKQEKFKACERATVYTWLNLNKQVYENDQQIEKILDQLEPKVCFIYGIKHVPYGDRK